MTKNTFVQAQYFEQAVLEYQGNPLIEALPPILSEENAAVAMSNFPEEPSDEERQKPKEIRLHSIDRLNRLVQPLPIYLELESVVSTVIRSGYVGRNPMSTQTWRHLYGLSAERGIATEFVSTASSFSLVGLSGIGKSTMLSSILKLYPQTIRHQKYRDTEFIHTQITYLKLDCPHDGSLSGLCRAFFRAVDKALGQDRYTPQLKSKASVPELIQKMEQVASTYFIGALFIDELQHLNSAKTGGKENMLNFFVNMINSIGIPVAFIGTNSMVNLFSNVMRNARRASGLGQYEFEQPKEDDPIWNLLLDAIWRYQWVKQPQTLDTDLRKKLYELTQGVTDFLAKLMILSQRYAIQTGKETLTTDLLSYIADTKMALLKPAISALRSGNPRQMKKFEDLLPTDEQLKAMMEPTDEEITLARLAVLSKVQPTTLPQKSSAKTEAKTQELASQQPPVQTTPEAIQLAQQSDPMEAMQKAGWLLQDPFEFSSTYRQS
ncbi:ATP-binding protein [Deefgea sp. CFH1-16]|uniref:ATP-binding protein n=1 Tax=Deefgea sp. CFH1-16 TaxID=2675457 RepID=UPI00194039A9|nr:ATP-binding protein [Deefgea sp. CFH1-16]